MTTLTLRAENALLGAMLADPALTADVARYLTAESFTSPRNQDVFRACQLTGTDPRPFAPAEWKEQVRRRAAETGVRGGYLDRLEASCPSPSHGRSYGALVMQAVARREIAASARQLAGTGDELHGHARKITAADGTGSQPLHDLGRHADAVASALRAHAQAFDPDITQLPPAAEPAAGGRARWEELALAAILQHDPKAEEILDLPVHQNFTDPDRAAIYRAARHLHDRGRDIDALTVDWETARRASKREPEPRHGTPPRSTVPSLAERLAALPLGQENIQSAAGFLRLRPESAVPKLSPDPPVQTRPGLLQPPPDLPGPAPGPVQR